MSHFSVCVIVPQSESGELLKVRQLEDRLQTILAPFDEQTEEPEYREFEDRTEEAKAGYEADTVQVVHFPDGTIHSVYDSEFRKRFYIQEGTIYEYGPDGTQTTGLRTEAAKSYMLINDYPVKLFYPSFETYCEEYCGYVQNTDGLWGYTFNPNAQWDWWQIGGRFSGNFLVKEDVTECIDTPIEPGEGNQAPTGYKYVDAARMKDICWDLMKKIAVNSAEANYARFVEAFRAGRLLEGMDHFAKITDAGIAGWSSMLYVKDETLDDYKARVGVTDIDKYRIRTYATVSRDGEWASSGDIGYFGLSANDKPERVWNDELQNLMNEVQDDDFIVVVDCHI